MINIIQCHDSRNCYNKYIHLYIENIKNEIKDNK